MKKKFNCLTTIKLKHSVPRNCTFPSPYHKKTKNSVVSKKKQLADCRVWLTHLITMFCHVLLWRVGERGGKERRMKSTHSGLQMTKIRQTNKSICFSFRMAAFFPLSVFVWHAQHSLKSQYWYNWCLAPFNQLSFLHMEWIPFFCSHTDTHNKYP